MDTDDYLLQFLPEYRDDDLSCPACGSKDFFFDKKTGEFVCRACWTRGNEYDFHYNASAKYFDRLLNED